MSVPFLPAERPPSALVDRRQETASIWLLLSIVNKSGVAARPLLLTFDK